MDGEILKCTVRKDTGGHSGEEILEFTVRKR